MGRRCWDLQILEASYRRSLCRHGGGALAHESTATKEERKEGPAHRQRKGGHTNVGTRVHAPQRDAARGERKGSRPCARHVGGLRSSPVRFGRGARGQARDRASSVNKWIRGTTRVLGFKQGTHANKLNGCAPWRPGQSECWNRGRRHNSDRTRNKHDDEVQGHAKGRCGKVREGCGLGTVRARTRGDLGGGQREESSAWNADTTASAGPASPLGRSRRA